jgi:hypothetical protein
MTEYNNNSMPHNDVNDNEFISPLYGSYLEESNPDTKDIKMVLDLYEQGKSEKKGAIERWDEYYRFYKGLQWPKERPSYRSDATFNVIKITIQSLLPILTDTEPGFDVLPEDPGDYEFARTLSKIVLSWWQKYDMNHTLVEILLDSMLYDAGIAKVVWDSDLNNGIGDVRINLVDPRNIYISPDARDFTEDKGCSWVIHEMYKTVGELRRKFPHLAHIIKPDSKKEDHEKELKGSNVKVTSPVDQEPKYHDTNSNYSSHEDNRQMVRVLECWMIDEALEEYEYTNEDGRRDIGLKKRYPHGKVITILPNQKLKLSEVKNPYRHGGFPFIRFVDFLLPRKFWGEGEVAPLISLQKQINKSLANIQDYMNTFSNPIWVKEKDCGVDSRSITNSYGMILTTDPGKMNSIKRMPPPAIPQYIFQFYETLIAASEKVSGVGEITQGRRPLSVTSGAAIETIQEAAHTRIRLKERNMKVSLTQMGRMIVSLMMQFYKEPRVARIIGKDGVWPEFFDFWINEKELPDGTIDYTMNTKKTIINENGKPIQDSNILESKPTKGIFDVNISSGTSLPFQKAQDSNLALTLHSKGTIDDRTLLEHLEWPNIEETMRRIEEQRAQMQQAQQPPQ